MFHEDGMRMVRTVHYLGLLSDWQMCVENCAWYFRIPHSMRGDMVLI